jgi:hypothetical protein
MSVSDECVFFSCVRVCVRVYVCACVRERVRGREREKGKEGGRGRGGGLAGGGGGGGGGRERGSGHLRALCGKSPRLTYVYVYMCGKCVYMYPSSSFGTSPYQIYVCVCICIYIYIYTHHHLLELHPIELAGLREVLARNSQKSVPKYI